MANPAKVRGTQFENRVRDYLRPVLPEIHRAPPAGSKDVGDFIGTWPYVIEAKNHRTITLAQFVDEAVREAKQAGGGIPAVIINRRNHGIERSYVVMELKDWRDMVFRDIQATCAGTDG